MKNLKQMIGLTLIVLLLAGCSANSGNSNNTGNTSNPASNEEAVNGSAATNSGSETESGNEGNEGSAVEVDKGLLNVDVTIPASFYEDTDAETVLSDAKEQGATKAVQNDDGSYTFTYPKSVHSDMMKELKQTIESGITETLDSGTFSSLKDVTYNDDFSEFTIVVDKEQYEGSMDAFVLLGLSVQGIMYNTFNGTDTTDMKVAFHLKDAATDEVYDTVYFPNDNSSN